MIRPWGPEVVIRPQKSADPPHGLTEVNPLQLVFPDTNDPPSMLSEQLGLSGIAFDVDRDLFGPPCRVGLRYPEVQAATVPEAAIHKDTDHLPGNTMSALQRTPGTGQTSFRNRKPDRWSADRSSLSGRVSRLVFARITRWTSAEDAAGARDRIDVPLKTRPAHRDHQGAAAPPPRRLLAERGK